MSQPPPESQAAPTAPRVVSGLGEQRDPRAKRDAALPLDERTYDRALSCVHCGLCLPACPTYTQNGLEADSPRGRIYLMKGLADGAIEPTDAVVEHLDLCLDCQACETACPSGVVYHELIEETRAKLGASRRRGVIDRLVEVMFYHVFPYPVRVKLAMLPARLLQKVGVWQPLARAAGRLLPNQLDKMQQMLPTHGPVWEKDLGPFYPADEDAKVDGKPRATVALLAGCVGSVLFQHVNRQTIRLLQHAGCDVVVPQAQVCCGAIHHHGGRHDQAVAFAKQNLRAFGPLSPRERVARASGSGEGGAQVADASVDTQAHGQRTSPHPAGDAGRPLPVGEVDYIVTNIAGCGAALKHYDHLLRDDPADADRAKAFAAKVRDVSEVLVELDPPRPKRRLERTVTYHDACHLAHAQQVTDPPRRLLGWIDGLNVIPLAESDMCCGAAGTYNLAQPEMARDLAERKIGHIQQTGARLCVTGNVGCAMQIQSEADRLGVELHVTHPVSLLYEAYFGDGEAGASD